MFNCLKVLMSVMAYSIKKIEPKGHYLCVDADAK